MMKMQFKNSSFHKFTPDGCNIQYAELLFDKPGLDTKRATVLDTAEHVATNMTSFTFQKFA